jgi:restriction system protein
LTDGQQRDADPAVKIIDHQRDSCGTYGSPDHRWLRAAREQISEKRVASVGSMTWSSGNAAMCGMSTQNHEAQEKASVVVSSIGAMGRRRGFFAELQHQQRLAEQRQRRQYGAAVQAHNRAVREAERAQREYARAVAAAQRASAVELAVAERAAKTAHIEAQRAFAESQTRRALDAFVQIDSILAATLDVDDFVDVDSLKQSAEHPPFDRDDLRKPLVPPILEPTPPEPQFMAPPAPSGMSKVFKKQQHAEAHAVAHAVWSKRHQEWADYVNRVLPAKNAKLLEDYASKEQHRTASLAAALTEFEAACAEREREAAETNESLDRFKTALASGDPEALTQYVGIVLGNSAYPEAFEVDHEFEFDPDLGELTVAVIVPAPSAVPNVKAYKYVAASDEIRETPCTQKEQRDRYNDAVAAVAIRTFHEVFEGDREGRIQTISLTVQTETINPATGLADTFPFVAAAADRQEFLQYDLANVDPNQTLTLLRALVSKNAFGLKPISTARGIR